MIVYGHRATELAKETLNVKCSTCGDSNTVQIRLYQRYFHVFWIPFIPLRKVGVTQCSHCKQVLTSKEFSGEIAENYQSLRIGIKTPKWTFIGLTLLLLFISWGIISSAMQDEKNAQMITVPQKDDVYQIRLGAAQYTLYKVEKINKDTVYILTNLYESNLASGLQNTKITEAESFGMDTILIPVDTLKSMLAKGTIIDIVRKEGAEAKL